MRAPSKKMTLPGAIVLGGVAVVGVVERAEVRGHADGVALRLDVLEHAGIPHALLAFTVGAVVIEVAQLPDERALPDAGAPDDRNAHGSG